MQETICLWCRKTVRPGEEYEHIHLMSMKGVDIQNKIVYHVPVVGKQRKESR